MARHESAPPKISGKRTHIVSAICVYTAGVSEEYLKKFDQPYEYHGPNLLIQRRVIPFKEESAGYLYESYPSLIPFGTYSNEGNSFGGD